MYVVGEAELTFGTVGASVASSDSRHKLPGRTQVTSPFRQTFIGDNQMDEDRVFKRHKSEQEMSADEYYQHLISVSQSNSQRHMAAMVSGLPSSSSTDESNRDGGKREVAVMTEPELTRTFTITAGTQELGKR